MKKPNIFLQSSLRKLWKKSSYEVDILYKVANALQWKLDKWESKKWSEFSHLSDFPTYPVCYL